MKNYETNVMEILRKIRPEYKYSVKEVLKDNGCVMTGIAVSKGSGISAVMYVDDLKESGMSCMHAAVRVAEKLADIDFNFYQNNVKKKVRDVRYVLDHCILRLINTELNKVKLSGSLARPWNDLSLVPYLVVGEAEDARMLMVITKEMLSKWKGVTEELIFQMAMENTPRIMGTKLYDPFEDFPAVCKVPFMACTNSDQSFGAVSVLFEDIRPGSFIIPSSVHEMLVLPPEFRISLNEIRNIVADVNREDVKDSEILSGNVYLKNEDGSITIA